MRRLVALAAVGIVLVGCAQLLGVDDLVYLGPDGALVLDAPVLDAPDADAAADAAACDAGSATDPHNCGACGRDCAGGACEARVCAPVTVLTESGLEPTIASDGTHVFVRSGAEVQSCPVTGCAAATHVWTTSSATPRLVAATATRVIWNDASAVYGCVGAGACGTPTTMVDLGSLALTGLAASSASSWVVASGWGGSTLRVLRSSTDGTSQDQVIAQSIGSSTSGAVVAVPQSTRVYWAEEGAPVVFDCLAPPCATPDHDTVALGLSPLGLVATISAAYFGTTSGLYVADKDLGSAKVFAGSGTVALVALSPVSESTVYWVEHAGASWTIASCAATTSCASPSPLYVTTTPITALTADAVALDWIEGTSVRRLVLP